MTASAAASTPSPHNASILPQVSSFSHQILASPDDSFASYLAIVQENLLPDPSFTRPPPRHNTLSWKLTDTEIDIFSAEKYFSTSTDAPPLDTVTTKQLLIPVDRRPSRTAITSFTKSRSLTSTITGSSRASSDASRNNHDALFQDRHRAFHLGGLGFWCSSCCRKHAAVNVSDASCATASLSHNTAFIEHKQNEGWSPVSWRIGMTSPGPWPWPGSANSSASSLRRCRPPPLPSVPMSKSIASEEDARSDSSSDLFEIESVGRSQMERAGGYEPSEASIAWSVVTASAANMSVASSDLIVEEKAGRRGQGRKSGGILLAGCSSHKAVEVVEQRAAGGTSDKGGLSAAVVVGTEVESSRNPMVARYHVELGSTSGSGRIIAGRSNGTSRHGGSGHIIS